MDTAAGDLRPSPSVLPSAYSDCAIDVDVAPDDQALICELVTRLVIRSNAVDLTVTAQLTNALWQYGNTPIYEAGELGKRSAPGRPRLFGAG